MRSLKESEKVIEKHLREGCKKRGWLCLKMRPVENGYPDRVIVIPGGLTVWVELKSTGCKLRPIQERRMEMLKGLGHKVTWADRKVIIDELLVKLDEMCKGRDTGELSDSVCLKRSALPTHPKNRKYVEGPGSGEAENQGT